MSITAVRNSPIGWRDQQEENWTQCANGYEQLWKDGERVRFQVVVGKIGRNILDDPLTPFVSGTTTSDGSSSLLDSGASFTTDGILVDHLVVNATANTQTQVASVVSDTQLGLDSDIFGTGTSGDAYEVLALRGLVGSVSYNDADNSLVWAPDASTNSVVIENAFPSTSERFVVEVDIEEYTGGTFYVQTGTFGGAFEETDSPRVRKSGTASFYMVPDGNDLRLIDGSNESNYTISAVRVYECSNVKWYLTDADFTSSFSDGIPTDLNYAHDRCTVNIDPSVVDGRYAIQVEDRLLTTNGGYLANGTFDSNSDFDWSITNTGTGWSITGNLLSHSSGGAVGTNYAEVELLQATDADCEYELSATVTGDGSTVEGKAADGTYTTLGTLTTGDSDLTFDGGAYTHIRFSQSETDTGTLDDIVLQPVGTCPELASYPICISDTVTEPYLEFKATVDTSRGGDFILDRRTGAGNYVEKVYLKANLRFARYDDADGEQDRDSVGRSTIVFSERIKVLECQLAPIPAWLHDWVTWALRSTLEIDSVEFYANDLAYSPNWDKRTALAPVVFDVAEQEASLQKTLCS